MAWDDSFDPTLANNALRTSPAMGNNGVSAYNEPIGPQYQPSFAQDPLMQVSSPSVGQMQGADLTPRLWGPDQLYTNAGHYLESQGPEGPQAQSTPSLVPQNMRDMGNLTPLRVRDYTTMEKVAFHGPQGVQLGSMLRDRVLRQAKVPLDSGMAFKLDSAI